MATKVKLVFGDDTRRLQLPKELTTDAVHSLVVENFKLVPGQFVVKYKDDEGDLCTLSPETVEDALDFVDAGSCLRLWVFTSGAKAPHFTHPSVAAPSVLPVPSAPEVKTDQAMDKDMAKLAKKCEKETAKAERKEEKDIQKELREAEKQARKVEMQTRKEEKAARRELWEAEKRARKEAQKEA